MASLANMSYHQGAYTLILDEKSSRFLSTLRSHLREKLIAPYTILRRKHRVPLILACTALVLTIVQIHHVYPYQEPSLSPSQSDIHPDLISAHLANPLPSHGFSHVDNETAFTVGKHHAVSASFPDNYTWIDPYSGQPFVEVMRTNGMNNNAMARMPAGSPYDMMVVGRGWSDKYMDPAEKIPYVNLTIVGFFVNFNPVTATWERSGPEPYILDLPVWRQFPRPCTNLVNGGPADPRLIWSDAGEPLAVIGTSSRVKSVCKAMGLVDLRAVWPGLKEHLEEIGYGDIPIKFSKFTEVGKTGTIGAYEKNWAPFFPGPKPATREAPWHSNFLASRRTHLASPTWPLFASRAFPRSILEVDPSIDASRRSPGSYVLARPVDLAKRVNDTVLVADAQCLKDSLPRAWRSNAIHQATPFYRVTFCRRGKCIPDRQNTVLLGLIHYKKSRRSYRRMFVTMSTDPPFQLLSVSPPLHFGETPRSVEIDKDVLFAVSLAFLPTKVAGKDKTPFIKSTDTPGGWLNHGWLDDTIVVGAGLGDEMYDSIHLPVETALSGHTLCGGGGTSVLNPSPRSLNAL
ncbi:hypothetical protein ACJZ2D_007492 [Fusarium nematophilum]